MASILPTIPPGISPTWYYLGMGLAVLITAVSKSGFGGGVGVLAIPLMVMIVGSKAMLGIILPVFIACDLLSNLHYFGEYDWGRLRWLLPGAAVGVAAGTLVLWWMNKRPPQQFDRDMSLIIGAICLSVVLWQLYRLTGRELPTLPPHPASAVSVAFVAGAVSTLNNASGPIITVYLLQEKLEKRVLVGTMLLYTLIINTVKLPTYLYPIPPDHTGLINSRTLADSIWFIPLIPIGTLIGAWMNRRIAEKPFAIVMYVATAITAAQMVWKSVQ
jgi:uncharacterized membrane protein YfcA